MTDEQHLGQAGSDLDPLVEHDAPTTPVGATTDELAPEELELAQSRDASGVGDDAGPSGDPSI